MEITKLVSNSFSYTHYLDEIIKQAAMGITSGPVQSEALVNYTRLNAHRMERVAKTLNLDHLLSQTIRELPGQNWFVFTETWCGDAAHALPLFGAMEKENKLINLRLLYRDENPGLFTHFLTNGKKSIPKLAVFDLDYELLFTWGPRPALLQQQIDQKKQDGIAGAEIAKSTQQWYNQDKTRELQKELYQLFSKTIS